MRRCRPAPSVCSSLVEDTAQVSHSQLLAHILKHAKGTSICGLLPITYHISLANSLQRLPATEEALPLRFKDASFWADTAVMYLRLHLLPGLEASADKLPDREVRMEISGPDPGYIATPIFLVHAALTLLDEREDIVSRLGSGGVFTPGALLTKTRFIGRIQKAGIKIIDLTEASTLSNSKR